MAVGQRSVASFDEDTTTMGVAAARRALAATDLEPQALWFATASPAYLEKTNATAVHAALQLSPEVGALDFGGALRSGAEPCARRSRPACRRSSSLLTSAEDWPPPPTRPPVATAPAVLIGDDTDGPVIAEYLGAGIATEEFLERWRLPGGDRSRAWEERFGEVTYGPLMSQAWERALAATSLSADDIDKLIVTGTHGRAVARNAKRLGVRDEAMVDDLSGSVGNTGTAHPLLVLTSALEQASPGETIAVMTLADGVEVIVLRTTDAIAAAASAMSTADQIASGTTVSYGTFLSWRGMVSVEPPNRPLPNRPSASAAHRRDDWKFGFVGSRDRSSGMIHLPPARVSEKGGAVDDMDPCRWPTRSARS